MKNKYLLVICNFSMVICMMQQAAYRDPLRSYDSYNIDSIHRLLNDYQNHPTLGRDAQALSALLENYKGGAELERDEEKKREIDREVNSFMKKVNDSKDPSEAKSSVSIVRPSLSGAELFDKSLAEVQSSLESIARKISEEKTRTQSLEDMVKISQDAILKQILSVVVDPKLVQNVLNQLLEEFKHDKNFDKPISKELQKCMDLMQYSFTHHFLNIKDGNLVELKLTDEQIQRASQLIELFFGNLLSFLPDEVLRASIDSAKNIFADIGDEYNTIFLLKRIESVERALAEHKLASGLCILMAMGTLFTSCYLLTLASQMKTRKSEFQKIPLLAMGVLGLSASLVGSSLCLIPEDKLKADKKNIVEPWLKISKRDRATIKKQKVKMQETAEGAVVYPVRYVPPTILNVKS
jgi:hypothetical protein